MQGFLRTMMAAIAVAALIALAGCAGGAQTGSASSPSSQAASSAVSQASSASPSDLGLQPGVYTADFKTDSSMFHVNEADDGTGVLTVTDDGATIHVRLASKKIVNLYAGVVKDARRDGADVIEPTVDEVTYSDGVTEEVYGFDIPVPALDEEFDVAILGSKDTWYDHKVSVSNPVAE